MAAIVYSGPAALDSDPFLERSAHPFKRRVVILGQRFVFESNSRRLLRLVDAAYRDLPMHRLGTPRQAIIVRLHLARSVGKSGAKSFPPPMRMHGARGLLCGAMDAENYAVLNPGARTGLVVVSLELLKYPYQARYELLEFAVFTLACRGQGLIPLHSACVGLNGRGLLLIGRTGAGKSTLAMLCALNGMDFLTEDATFIAPRSMRGTGVANYLHIRKDALRHVADRRITALIRRSPIIKRRSGVEKYEIDMRRTGLSLAGPLDIAAIVFVTARRTDGPLLTPLKASATPQRLLRGQGYGAAQRGWRDFARHVRTVPAYELLRGTNPLEAVDALRRLLVTAQ